MTLEELEFEALALDVKDRIRLLETLSASVDDPAASESAQRWAIESRRRLKELEDGLADEIPLEEVLRRARAALS